MSAPAPFEAVLWKATEAFLSGPLRLGTRQWLRTPGGEAAVYLRMGMRSLDPAAPRLTPTLELGSLSLREDLLGRGWFRRYLRALGTLPQIPDTLILESVNAPRLLAHAGQHWRPLPNTPLTFFLTREALLAYPLKEET